MQNDSDEEENSDGVPNKRNAEYNHVFSELITQAQPADALEGYIAYVGYKIVKREWVQQFYKDNGHHPGEAEMRAYISTWTPTMIDNLRSRAKLVLTAYASYIVEKSTPQIREAALRDRSFVRDALVAFCGAFFLLARTDPGRHSPPFFRHRPRRGVEKPLSKVM